jgi:hypothetical protein
MTLPHHKYCILREDVFVVISSFVEIQSVFELIMT